MRKRVQVHAPRGVGVTLATILLGLALGCTRGPNRPPPFSSDWMENIENDQKVDERNSRAVEEDWTWGACPAEESKDAWPYSKHYSHLDLLDLDAGDLRKGVRQKVIGHLR